MEFKFIALILVAINLVVFPLQPFLPMDQLILVSSDALARPWTVVTHMFLHGSPLHLMGNMFALGLFGSILERLVGWRRFLLVFFLGGFISSLGDIMFYNATLGASGALFGVLGAVAVIKPKMGVPAFGAILPMALAAVFWVLVDLSGMLYPDNVAHAAHLFGMAAGIVMGFIFRPPGKKVRKEKLISDEDHRKWEEEYLT